MLRAISEIESIGDSCYNLARTIKRKGENKEEFTAKQNENIHQMFKLVDESLTQMNFMFAHDRQSINMNHTYNIETEINNFRTQLRNQNLDDVDNHLYTYGVGTLYMDIIQECEKLGDYVVNVARHVWEREHRHNRHFDIRQKSQKAIKAEEETSVDASSFSFYTLIISFSSSFLQKPPS